MHKIRQTTLIEYITASFSRHDDPGFNNGSVTLVQAWRTRSARCGLISVQHTVHRVALASAISREFVDVVPIEGYADSLPGSSPRRNRCNDQVMLWLLLHPADEPVRGWISESSSGRR